MEKRRKHHKKREFKGKHEKHQESSYPIPLFMWDFKQCDPKKCTGVKLRKFKILKDFSKKSSFKGIVLTPTAKITLNPEDREIVEERGICVIDCSWNEFNKINLSKLHNSHERCLPYIIASNPVNYGKPFKLTCAEAIATTLMITKFEDVAYDIMNRFKWGHGFLSLNQELFQMYSECETENDIKVSVENYMKEQSENAIDREALRFKMLNPPSDSDSDHASNEEEQEHTSDYAEEPMKKSTSESEQKEEIEKDPKELHSQIISEQTS